MLLDLVIGVAEHQLLYASMADAELQQSVRYLSGPAFAGEGLFLGHGFSARNVRILKDWASSPPK